MIYDEDEASSPFVFVLPLIHQHFWTQFLDEQSTFSSSLPKKRKCNKTIHQTDTRRLTADLKCYSFWQSRGETQKGKQQSLENFVIIPSPAAAATKTSHLAHHRHHDHHRHDSSTTKY